MVVVAFERVEISSFKLDCGVCVNEAAIVLGSGDVLEDIVVSTTHVLVI